MLEMPDGVGLPYKPLKYDDYADRIKLLEYWS
jgi:hypothetical protein